MTVLKHWTYDCTKTLCEGCTHKVLQVSSWTRMAVVVGTARYETQLGYNRAYSQWSNFLSKICFHNLHIVPVALEGSDDSYSEWKSSKFTDGLNVACSHEGFLCTFVSRPAGATAIPETIDAYNYFHCSDVRTILWQNGCCMLCWSPVTSRTGQLPRPPNHT